MSWRLGDGPRSGGAPSAGAAGLGLSPRAPQRASCELRLHAFHRQPARGGAARRSATLIAGQPRRRSPAAAPRACRRRGRSCALVVPSPPARACARSAGTAPPRAARAGGRATARRPRLCARRLPSPPTHTNAHTSTPKPPPIARTVNTHALRFTLTPRRASENAFKITRKLTHVHLHSSQSFKVIIPSHIHVIYALFRWREMYYIYINTRYPF